MPVQLLKKIIPRGLVVLFKNAQILRSQYGQYRSAGQFESIDANGQPIPWYSYPAVEYIRALDFSDKRVFEYGSGNSTRFWSQRCNSMVSIEDNKQWYEKIKSQLPANVAYEYHDDKPAYTQAIHQHEGDFDVIISPSNMVN